jgi:transglutaminase-like putative cysteine protease
MLTSPSVHLAARSRPQDSIWELALRYLAATAATLLAVAGAQLVTPNPIIWALTALTLIGVPVSLALRLSNLRIGGVTIPRPLLNSATVLLSFGAAAYFVFLPMGDFFGPILSGNVTPDFWINFGGGEPILALMELFLFFAAFRSFALISDKDCTLTTVPSFSVLLLLIPIQKGIEVVVYFVAWTLVAATLFALDHRSEVRANVSAIVPSVEKGQDVRLGARSLATILGISLLAATGISLYLASRDPGERSATEAAVTSLASRITNLALSIPDASVNSGPERQIDFKSSVSLPTRAPIWQVQAWRVDAPGQERQRVYPTYWRMFTLSNYNGVSWEQDKRNSSVVPRAELAFGRWPRRRYRGSMEGGFGGASRGSSGQIYGDGFRDNFSTGFLIRLIGHDIERANPHVAQQFGKQRAVVRQQVTSLRPNIGFLPAQPAVRALVIPDGQQKALRLRGDGAIDIGVLQIGQTVSVLSDVPPLPEYGIAGNRLLQKGLTPAQIAASGVTLSRDERITNLRLPATLPLRVRELSKTMLGRVSSQASNYVKAQRIALAIQDGAVYTLRPPTIPEGRDATDYFLFDGARRGYCTYFAGALTVLCRAQNIPARVVSGFGGIEWEGPEAGLLREGNAHAWTEIWVEGFGWTVVDATPPSERGDNAPTWIESWGDWLVLGVSDASDWVMLRRNYFAGLLLVLLLVGFTKKARTSRFSLWGRRLPDDDIERRAIAKIYRRTARAYVAPISPQTGLGNAR